MKIGEKVNMSQKAVAAIVKVAKEYSASTNAGDFERWMSVWPENGIQYFPDAPPRYGKEQIAVAMKPGFDTLDFHGFAIDLTDIQVFGDKAYAHGTYGYSVTPKGGGDTTRISGKFLTIWTKQADGPWKILIDCFNYNGPSEQV